MAGTTTKSRRTSLKNSDLQDLLVNFNLLVTDVGELCRGAVMGVMPGLVVTAPSSGTGTSDAKTWRTEAFTFTFRGKVTSSAAQEKALTGTTHDVAASKQAWLALSVQTNGTSYTVTKAADQTIGTDVYPTTPDNEILVARCKIVTGTTGYVANTDNLAVSGQIITAITFQDAPALGAAGQLAAMIGNQAGTAITTTAG